MVATQGTTTRPAGTALWPAGLVAAAAAAAVTTAIALIGRALGAPLAVDGEAVPLAAFPALTVIGAVAGIALAAALARWARRPRRTFVPATIVLTALSLIPDLVVQASAGSKVVLMLTHVAAAAVVIPTLSRRLRAG